MQSFGPRFPSCARLRRSFVAGLALVAAAMPALGQAPKGSVSLIRDAEIEQLLRDYAAPIFKAAGINARGTRIILINDRAFNAFVADSYAYFAGEPPEGLPTLRDGVRAVLVTEAVLRSVRQRSWVDVE